MNNTNQCPCGSLLLLAECCSPVLAGEGKSLTAEQLMRSRYTAYTQSRTDYLLASWAPETRPDELDLDDENIQWIGLEIEQCKKGGAEDSEGTVTFTARFLSGGHHCKIHECSRFIKSDGTWYYLDGISDSSTCKTGRNAPCPCGSGMKFKKCCLKKG